MIDALYCRSTAVLLAMHVWLYVVAVLYMVSDAGRPHGVPVLDLVQPQEHSLGQQGLGKLRLYSCRTLQVYR